MKTNPCPRRFIPRTALLLAVATAITAPLSFAADNAREARTDASQPRLSHSDMSFVNKLAKLNADEVQLSKLATTQAAREDVRDYAAKLVAAHEKADADLSMLASNKGLVLPTDSRESVEKWAKKRGTEFDKDYLDKMVDAHEDAVDLLQKNATDAEDSDVAAFARHHLAEMQEHLRTARELKKAID